MSEPTEWRKIVKTYAQPNTGLGVWQATSTFVLFVACWAAAYWVSEYSLWLAIVAALPAALCVERISSIQHECGHGSFVAPRWLNTFLGVACSLVTIQPFHFVRRAHAIHHREFGKLEGQRGVGDRYVMTVAEYLAAPKSQQAAYRRERSLTGLFVSTFLLFFVMYRYDHLGLAGFEHPRRMLRWTNTALLILTVAGLLIFDPVRFLVVHVAMVYLGSLFDSIVSYMQHNFEGYYYATKEKWRFYDAALQGSSLWKLPWPLEWVTLHSTYHHLHHLSPTVPNYMLARCARENPQLAPATTLTLGSLARCLRLALWDETSGKMITFRELEARVRMSGGLIDMFDRSDVVR